MNILQSLNHGYFLILSNKNETKSLIYHSYSFQVKRDSRHLGKKTPHVTSEKQMHFSIWKLKKNNPELFFPFTNIPPNAL